MKNLLIYIITITLLSCQGRPNADQPPAQDQPNIILVITDDQGYGDLSFHGNTHLQTAHLDQLASESIRLTNYHSGTTC